MTRPQFITIVAGAATWSLAAVAQTRLPKIGVLVPANPEPFWTELRAGLRDHGYSEGQNVVFEFRPADGNPNRLRELEDELVRLKVDIIVTHFTPSATAARAGDDGNPDCHGASRRSGRNGSHLLLDRAATSPADPEHLRSFTQKHSNSFAKYCRQRDV